MQVDSLYQKLGPKYLKVLSLQMKIFEEMIPLLKGEYNQWEKVWLPILLLDALNVNKLFLRVSIFHKLEAGFQTCVTLLFPHSYQFFV